MYESPAIIYEGELEVKCGSGCPGHPKGCQCPACVLDYCDD